VNPEHYAKEAERLLADDVLKHAFDTVRADALEALVTADVNDPIKVLRLQQTVAVIDDIRAELRGAIARLPNTANSTGTFA
jgi:uncharacterized protein YfdQ (DUF2303 family)